MKMLRVLIAATVFAGVAIISTAMPASAGSSVDPETLIPVPPPGASCDLDGNQIICHTTFVESDENNGFADLPCGTLYETATSNRWGIRTYHTSDRKLVTRRVFEDLSGFWSLSPTGEGPVVSISAHDGWVDQYTIPGDEDSASETFHGEFKAQLPGSGAAVHGAGIDLVDGTHHGVSRWIEDQLGAEAVCEALQA